MKVLYIFIPTIHSTSHFAGINHTYSNSYHYWFMDRQSAFWGYYPGKYGHSFSAMYYLFLSR